MKEKILMGFKKYKSYLLVTLTSVALLAVILTVALLSAGTTNEPSEEANTSTVQFVLPISNGIITKGYSAEELQYNATLNCWEIHRGLDLLATVGEDVLACYDGVVSNVYTNYLEGTTIEIKHDNGLVSVYQGLSNTTLVNVNDNVSVGQSIGTVANLLQVEGEEESHIHFELLKDGEKIDPANYIEIGLKD